MPEGVARVFFREREVGFQLLSEHHRLVTELLEAWRVGEAPLEAHPRTRGSLLRAARYHDSGKVHRFRLEPGPTYSFKGHRFLLDPALQEDPYAQALVRGHHDYSTPEVVGQAAGLQDPRFPEDLFLLMMADQLEAELLIRTLEGQPGEVRPFVEFDLIPEGEGVYELDPWPFTQEELRLEVRAYFRPYPGGKAKAELREEDLRAMEAWAQALAQGDGEEFREEVHTLTLRPWPRGEKLPEEAEAFYALFGLRPSGFQKRVFEKTREEAFHLLLAPTGVGKTEAALFPVLARGGRAVYVLPTRSLTDDLETRLQGYLKTLARHTGRPQRLILDTGHRQERLILCPDDPESPPDGKPKPSRERHLYHGEVILTTLDKFLYRYFGYAEGVKSYTYPKRIHDGRTRIIFDEVHLYEATAWVNFRLLVEALYKKGIEFLLLTATMPQAYRQELAQALGLREEDFVLEAQPEGERPSRRLHLHPVGEAEVLDRLEELARERIGRRVLLVVEEVRQAVELYRRLRGEGVYLYHGRLAEGQRRWVYGEVKARDGAKKPYLLITTPAIEVGVDLDAEVLLTTLCPPENLLQRLGRCNRKGKSVGEVHVVGRSYPAYLGALPEGYLELLESLQGQDLAQGGEGLFLQAIRYPRYLDPRAESLFGGLYDYVYGLDLTYEPLHRKGFLATRGWTPSVRLEARNGDWVEVGVNLLIAKKEEEVHKAPVYELHFANREEGGGWVKDKEPLHRGGELYGRTLLVEYPLAYEPEIGFAELPKVFRRGYHPDPERVVLIYEPAGAELEGVVESDAPRRVVLWFLADSALVSWEAGGAMAAEAPEAEEAEEEEA